MNYYIIVEGITEKKIYKSWIPILNPLLKSVDFVDNLKDNNFFIMSGGGYPAYLDLIDGAIDTINSINSINRLIIAVDSEDNTKEAKKTEIDDILANKTCSCEVHVIIQHFCIEAWGLGNIKIGPRNPSTQIVKDYKLLYNVLTEDPELLPPNTVLELNRAQFAYSYIKALFNDKNRQMTHSKSNPKTMMHEKYLLELIARHKKSGHIDSFNNFVSLFIAS